jgi:hypothetical protein
VVHAGAVNGQPAFATQGVVDGQQDNAGGREDADNQESQAHIESIEVPGSVAKEAMEA